MKRWGRLSEPAPPHVHSIMHPRLPLLTLGLAVAALAVHAIPGAAELLQFDRAALAQGEWWRWFTGHLAHFGANHLVWDVSVLMGLGWTCEREARLRCVLALALAAPAISVAIAWLQPQFAIYRGLSGLDCALFGLLAGRLLRRGHRVATAAGVLALAAVGAKAGFEIATEATLFARGGGYAPVPLAHLVGLAAGFAAAFAPRVRTTFRFRASG